MQAEQPKIKIKKKRLGAYPYASVVFSITLALFMVGALGLLAIHSRKLTKLIQENVVMQVYLQKDISEASRLKIRKLLEGYDFVAKDQEGLARIEYISRDEAARQFIAETGENFVEFLGENPLRDVYIIHIAEPYQTEARMAEIAATLQQVKGVYEVEYVENLVQAINRNVAKAALILGGFAVILLLVVVVLINNTIKLALFSQRFLIRSMQLVGAKAGFIRQPFLLRSVLHGMAGGLLASALLYALAEYAYSRIPDLLILRDTTMLLYLMGALMLLGALIGFFSTLNSINKYLKLSLDELY